MIRQYGSTRMLLRNVTLARPPPPPFLPLFTSVYGDFLGYFNSVPPLSTSGEAMLV